MKNNHDLNCEIIEEVLNIRFRNSDDGYRIANLRGDIKFIVDLYPLTGEKEIVLMERQTINNCLNDVTINNFSSDTDNIKDFINLLTWQ